MRVQCVHNQFQLYTAPGFICSNVHTKLLNCTIVSVYTDKCTLHGIYKQVLTRHGGKHIGTRTRILYINKHNMRCYLSVHTFYAWQIYDSVDIRSYMCGLQSVIFRLDYLARSFLICSWWFCPEIYDHQNHEKIMKL